MSIPFPTPSPIEIWEVIRKIQTWRIKKTWERLSYFERKARTDPNLCLFLQYLYPDVELLKYDEFLFPIVVFEAPESQWDDLDSVLVKPLEPQWLQETLFKDEQYFKLLKKVKNLGEYNRITFRMTKLNVDKDSGQIKLAAGLATYFDALMTSYALAWELLTKFGKLRPMPSLFGKFEKKLKLRQILHAHVDNPIFDGAGRSAAIGCSTLILYRGRDDRYKAILRIRSQRVAVSSDLYHVVPSYMFQAITDELDAEFSVLHQFKREYLEELFSIPEVTFDPGTISYDYFYDNANLSFLDELIKNKKAQLLFTGVAVDLLGLRPEICSLLFINTSEWITAHTVKNRLYKVSKICINEEFKKFDECTPEVKHFTIDLGKHITLSQDIKKVVNPANIVPQGAAAFFLGINVARRIVT